MQLLYHSFWLSSTEAAQLLERFPLESSAWSTAHPGGRPDEGGARRVQQWGFAFDYALYELAKETPGVVPLTHQDAMPKWLQEIGNRAYEALGFKSNPSQVIVNEYLDGQGIGAHADHPCFGPEIAIVSLGDPMVMSFARRQDIPTTFGQQDIPTTFGGDDIPRTSGPQDIPTTFGAPFGDFSVPLVHGSLLGLSDDLRWNWLHSIAPNQRLRRRVSLTYRTIQETALQALCEPTPTPK
ncbi:Alkbh8 [Symbiodinium sp. KB8]|nr:Alkbh8 [Symbiodinium sp. KB8]